MEALQSQAIGLLDDVGVHVLDKIPGMAVLTGVSLFAATVGDDVRHNYMLHYWLTFTAGFGGGLSSGLLLMRPDIIPLNFFTGYTDAIFTLCWWLVNYFPFNIPGRIVRTPFVTEITKLLLLVAVGKVMTHRLDTALYLHPQATIGALIVGSLGGCGGKIINDIIRGGYHISKEPDEMRVPGIGVNRAVFCCAMYYALVHVYNVLKPRQGTTLIILILWTHTLLLDLTGVNPLKPLVSGFHTIFNIPQPIPPASRAPIKPPAKPTSSSTISDSKKTT